VHKEDCFVSGRKLEVAIVELLVIEFILLRKTSVQGNYSKKKLWKLMMALLLK
jgi:hypothetical protein